MAQYWSVEVNKGLSSWWNAVFTSLRSSWESITLHGIQQGGSAAFWFRQIDCDINDEEFTIAVLVSPTAGNTKLTVEAKVIDGIHKGEKATLGPLKLSAAPYEVAAKVGDWLAKVFKTELAAVGGSVGKMTASHEKEIIATLAKAGSDDLAKAFAKSRGYRVRE